MRKKVNSILIALLILSATAFGTLMFNEDFDYPIGDSLTLHGFLEYSAGENPISVCAPGLTYTGYQNSGIGNGVLVDTSGQDIKRNYQLPSQDSGIVYVSFMVKVTKVTSTGDYFFFLGENPFTSGYNFGRVFVQDYGSPLIQFGLSQFNENETYEFGNFHYYDSTYLLVLKYEFISGAGNDEVSMFIFDSGIPSSEPVTPTIGPLSSGVLDATDIGSIELRQGNAADAPRSIVDGIRIGTDWSDLISPIPTLISPVDSAAINTQTPTFIWNAVVYGDSNNLVVDGPTKVGLDIYTLDTIYTPSINLDTGTYNWKVRTKYAGTWSDFSTPRTFTIDITPPEPPDSAIYPQNGSTIDTLLPVFIWTGVAEADSYNIVVKSGVSWHPKQSLLNLVKDGGALVTVPGGKSEDKLYAFRGYKSNLFYMYDEMGWAPKESLQFGLKPPDFVKFNKKYPGKGAALCYDGNNTIYATRGNGTWEFWAYTISDSTWTAKAFVPSTQKLKGGTSIAYKGGKVYLLAGAQKKDNYNNFFVYNPPEDTVGDSPWTALAGAPIIPPATGKAKPFKDGSAISIIGNTIYAIKGGDKYNFFYAYDIDSNEWTEMESIPRIHPQLLKKNKVGDGGAMTNDGSELYIIKGKGKNDFWKYTPGAKGVWTPLEMTPFGPLNKNPKTGAALTYSDGSIWLLKGNKTNEFWQYGPSGAAGPKGVGVKIDEIIVDSTYATTTELGEGSYSWSVRSKDDAGNWSEFSEEWTFEIDVTPKNVNPPTVIPTVVEKTFTTPNFNIDITPNPFTKLTTIRYIVPISGKVSVKLYNATGRLIETLVNEYQNAGSYTLEIGNWKLEIPRGIYFLKYESTANKAKMKLIVQ